MKTKELVKSANFSNPDGLSKEHLNALALHLGRLAELDAQVAAAALRYVVDGSDEEVLLTLGGMKDAAQALMLSGLSYPQSAQWEKMRNTWKERALVLFPDQGGSPGVWFRLAHVFAAAWNGAGQAKPTLPGWPAWLAVLIDEMITIWWNMHPNAGQGKSPRPLGELEAVLKLGDLPNDLLARSFLDEQALRAAHRGGGYYSGQVTSVFRGWNEYLSRQLQVIRDALARTDADHRLHVLQTLGQMQYDFAPVVDLLVQLATGTAKTVREAALALLGGHVKVARPHIDKVLAEGDASQRHEAALLLWRLVGRDAAEPLRRHAAQEPSERVKQTIEKLLAVPEAPSTDVEQALAASLPPLTIALGVVDLPLDAKAGILATFEKAWEHALADYERSLQQWNAPNRPQWMTKPVKPERIQAQKLDELIRFVEGKTSILLDSHNVIRGYAWRAGPLGDWLAPPGVRLIHVVRMAFAFGHMQFNPNDSIWWHNLQPLEAFRARCSEPFGLRELDAAVATLPGGKPGMVATAYLSNNSRYQSFCDWGPQAVWPVFVEHPAILHQLLGPSPNRGADYTQRDYWWPQKRHNAFKVLAMFPRLPRDFIPLLWDLALGDSKADRPLAQAALATVPDKASKIQVALQDGKQAVRAAAAEWLGKIGDAAAIEPLKEAVRKEKQEFVKGTMMAALEALGADVQEFLDRGALLAEAEAGLKKKRPRGMEWVPLESLPPLHWADTGASVDPPIVQWWLVQSIQQKTPVPGPLLRRYLGQCRKHEAAALAKFVLAVWIGRDTAMRPQEVAAEMAQKEADKMWAAWGGHQYYQQMYDGNKDNLYRQLFQKLSTDCMGSAIDQKGMLALAAAAGDGECVKLCDQYIRKWFGNRLAQCKALVEVLAWSAHPLAIQVLLAFANRFRTKAVRKAAEEHVQALAEREGWTIDELADRTIPDAGFERPADESGAPVVGAEANLVLDYGPRKFLVKLADELQPVITTEEGKTVKNPPAPGKQDDAELAKAAKKAFTDAKKVIKEVVKRQTERLYEALCTQRGWRFDDWRRYLAEHPVVGKLCVRVAWAAVAPGKDGAAERFLGCFRPLEDGSLTNEKDEEAHFDGDTLVRLAHTCNTPAEVGSAWLQHFEDYDVTPLFQQFGRATFSLPEEKQKETDVTDFEGHAVTTFRLRGKANKLGYVRGDAEDGGCFYLYRKPFPSLGLQAVLEFTGSGLPETDRPAALTHLYFQSTQGKREAAHSWQASRLPLGKVPPVLLSECYNDIKQIAAEGTGYNPKWKEISYY
jgi:HEAT repeat protein